MGDGVIQWMGWLRDGTVDHLLPPGPDRATLEMLYIDYRSMTAAVAGKFPNLFGPGEQVQALLAIWRYLAGQ